MVECVHRQLKWSLKARESGKYWLEHLCWVLFGLRVAPKEDVAVSSGEVFIGNHMVLPHQARMKEDAGGVPEITLRQRSFAEEAGSRPSLLDVTTHVYVRRSNVCGLQDDAYSGPYKVVRHGKKVLLLELWSCQEWAVLRSRFILARLQLVKM